jgi:hypothetical protein
VALVLHHVRQLVRQHVVPGPGLWRVVRRVDVHVGAGGEGGSMQPPGGRARLRVRVNAHVGKFMPKAWLQKRSRGRS